MSDELLNIFYNKIVDKFQSIEEITEVNVFKQELEDDLKEFFKFEHLLIKLLSIFNLQKGYNIDHALKTSLKLLGTKLDIDRCTSFQFHYNGMVINQIYQWKAPKVSPITYNLENLYSSSFPWIMKRLRNREMIVVSNVDQLTASATHEKQYFTHLQTQSFVLIPLDYKRNLLGFLLLENIKKTKRWPTHVLSFLKIIGDFFSTALNRKKIEQEINVKKHELNSWIAQIQHLLQILPVGIVGLDDEANIILNNATFNKYYKRATGTKIHLGMSCLYGEDHNKIIDTIANIFLHKETDSIIIEAADQFHLQFDVNTFGEEYTSFHTLITIQDVSDFINFEAMRKNFITNISHEFRTPVTIIDQNIKLIKTYNDKLPIKKRIQLLNSIDKNSNLLTKLVEQMVLISRLDVKRPIIEWKPYLLVKVVTDALNNTVSKYNKKHIITHIDISKDIRLYGDKKKLQTVFENIFDNAIKFSNQNPIINIEASNCYKTTYIPNSGIIEGTLVKITDHGRGIREKNISRIFNRFFRSEDVIKANIQGTGLGLSIALELVILHGGYISIESEYGKKTTVNVFLPKEREFNHLPNTKHLYPPQNE